MTTKVRINNIDVVLDSEKRYSFVSDFRRGDTFMYVFDKNTDVDDDDECPIETHVLRNYEDELMNSVLTLVEENARITNWDEVNKDHSIRFKFELNHSSICSEVEQLLLKSEPNTQRPLFENVDILIDNAVNKYIVVNELNKSDFVVNWEK